MSNPLDASQEPATSTGSRWRIVAGALALLFLASSPLWGPRLFSRFAFFRVRRVEVVGTRYTPADEVLARLRVDTMQSVWQPLGPLVARVTSHPQVASVVITRKLPGTLVVAVTERRPVALISTAAGLTAVDADGRLLPLDPSRTPVDAPVVAAAARDVAVYHLLGMIQREAPRLYARINSVGRPGAGELLFRLPNLQVRAMTNVTLARLSDIEPVEQDIARRQLQVTELDLRYRDQVIARLP